MFLCVNSVHTLRPSVYEHYIKLLYSALTVCGLTNKQNNFNMYTQCHITCINACITTSFDCYTKQFG